MTKRLILFFALMLPFVTTKGQCDQNKPNSLFPAETFFSFLFDVEDGEEKLLSWDFCLAEVDVTPNGQKYYSYRLNHTLNQTTGKFQFDNYSITNDGLSFHYLTSSNKNFVEYKRKLIDWGFTQLYEDTYEKKIKGKTYIMSLQRNVYRGTPNYKISLFDMD